MPADPVWNSRAQQVGELLTTHLSCHRDTHARVVELAKGELERVPTGGATARKAALCVGGFPSLSSHTIHVWIRCAVAPSQL